MQHCRRKDHANKHTVILVAHRLSTLLHSDRILVFDNGRIVETGTYDELVQQGGLFGSLVNSAGDHTTTSVHAAQPVAV